MMSYQGCVFSSHEPTAGSKRQDASFGELIQRGRQVWNSLICRRTRVSKYKHGSPQRVMLDSPKERGLSVVIANAEEDPAKARGQVEAIADKLAELLERGQILADAYTFKADKLAPGLPRK